MAKFGYLNFDHANKKGVRFTVPELRALQPGAQVLVLNHAGEYVYCHHVLLNTPTHIRFAAGGWRVFQYGAGRSINDEWFDVRYDEFPDPLGLADAYGHPDDMEFSYLKAKNGETVPYVPLPPRPKAPEITPEMREVLDQLRNGSIKLKL